MTDRKHETASDLLAREGRRERARIERLERVLLELPPDLQDVLHGLYFDAASEEELAGRLGATPEEVRALEEAALGELRSRLEEAAGEPVSRDRVEALLERAGLAWRAAAEGSASGELSEEAQAAAREVLRRVHPAAAARLVVGLGALRAVIRTQAGRVRARGGVRTRGGGGSSSQALVEVGRQASADGRVTAAVLVASSGRAVLRFSGADPSLEGTRVRYRVPGTGGDYEADVALECARSGGVEAEVELGRFEVEAGGAWIGPEAGEGATFREGVWEVGFRVG